MATYGGKPGDIRWSDDLDTGSPTGSAERFTAVGRGEEESLPISEDPTRGRPGYIHWSKNDEGAPPWPVDRITPTGWREIESIRAADKAAVKAQGRYELMCLVLFLLFLAALGSSGLH